MAVALEAPAESKAWIWTEIFAVILVTVAPGVWDTLRHGYQETGPAVDVGWAFWHACTGSVPWIFPALFLIGASGREWKDFGVVRVRWVRDLGLGILLSVVFFASGLAVTWAITRFTSLQPHPWQRTDVSTPARVIPFSFAMLVMALGQELSIRALVQARLAQVLPSQAGALVISALVAGASCFWMGTVWMLDAAVGGLIAGFVFWKTRSIWPGVVAHAILFTCSEFQ